MEWTVAPPAIQAFRIDCCAIVGAPLNGNRFGSDAFFDGGSAGTVDVVSDFGVVTKRPEIAGVADRANVASFREGTFGYRVPLADGHYRVTLTFVERPLSRAHAVSKCWQTTSERSPTSTSRQRPEVR
jgi:beta-galactosidase